MQSSGKFLQIDGSLKRLELCLIKLLLTETFIFRVGAGVVVRSP
jgi:hypothetical protein